MVRSGRGSEDRNLKFEPMVEISKLSQAARVQIATESRHSAIETARQIVDSPAMQAAVAVQENLATTQLLADLTQSHAVLQAAWQSAGILDRVSDLHEIVDPLRGAMDEFSARFSLPDLSDTVKLMQQFQQSPEMEEFSKYAASVNEIQRAMDAMHTPWLDAQESQRSIAGFARIQGIGSILNRTQSFDDVVSKTLRSDLGDWRDKITWPEPVLTDKGVRAAFYVDRGFDATLTDRPAPAFHESAEIAGLRRQPPPLVANYGEPVPRVDSDSDEEALVLTNAAHDWLQRLESHLRRFIDTQMAAVFGPDWPRTQLPNGVYDQWKEKRESAVKAGRQPKQLIAYADFTDYERVICKKDNWRQVFKGYFIRPESVRECFQRMHPIRLDTMHARIISQDDELLLYVEVRRLISVISK